MNVKGTDKKLLEISKKTGLPLKKILDLLFVLVSSGSIENNELLRKVGVSKNVLNQVKKELQDILEPTSSETIMKKSKLSLMRKMFSNDYLLEEELWRMLENDDYKKVVDLLKKYKKLQPPSARKYDQFTATHETVAKRACLMDFFADISDKRLFFLGDDDFTSVCCASYKTAENIQVLDIDERILNSIQSLSKKEGLGIRTEKFDARNVLAKKFERRFDVIFTDPPYTENGVKLFLSRAIDALDLKNQSSRIYLCYGNSDRAKERFLPIYEILTGSGLMIRWVFDKFNRYRGAESIGSTSSLFVCDTTPKTRPIIVGDCNNPIYSN